MSRRGDWMQTFTGRRFYPLDPRPEDIDQEDIAHALANLCRFGGHCRRFYSVAEHSVLVSQVVPPEDALVGLLHDATEAYLVDVPRPIKRSLSNYADIEEQLWRVISYKFDVPFHMPPSVKKADNDVLLAERDALLGYAAGAWDIPGEAAKVEVWGRSPMHAKELFLDRLNELLHERISPAPV